MFSSFAKFFLAIIISISQKYLNRGQLSNFWWPRSTNHAKFTEESVMCTEKCFVLVKKKTVYKWANYEFASTSLN